MKYLNQINEFKLPNAQGIAQLQLLEHLLLKLNEITKSLEPEGNDNEKNVAQFSKEDSIQLGNNLFQISRALSFALQDPERLSSFSRTMTSKLAQTFEAIRNKKIEVIDHTGDEYFATMLVKVLDFDKKPEITKPTITETIEPTIYFNDEMVKMGKVIVTTNQ